MNYSAFEALANAVIGLVVSWSLTLLVLGYSPAQSAGITAMFFCTSFARSWAIREAFRKWLSHARPCPADVGILGGATMTPDQCRRVGVPT